MRRRALIAGCGLALLACAGCAMVRPRDDRPSGSPASPLCQSLSQTAQEAIDRRDYERARVELERLVAESPRSAGALHRLGRVLQLQGRLAEAEASYRRALALDPEYVEAMIGQGEVAAQLGRPVDALEPLGAAIEIAPNKPEAHFALGRVLESLGRTGEAL